MSVTKIIIVDFILAFNNKNVNFDTNKIGIKLAQHGLKTYNKHRLVFQQIVNNSNNFKDLIKGLNINTEQKIDKTKLMLIMIGCALLSVDITLKNSIIDDFSKLEPYISWKEMIEYYEVVQCFNKCTIL